jgi:hypothetical protein
MSAMPLRWNLPWWPRRPAEPPSEGERQTPRPEEPSTRPDAGSPATEPTGSHAAVGAAAGFGGGDREGEYVTVYRAGSMEEAYIVRGRLASEGVPALVRRNTLGSLYPVAALSGTEVQVPRLLRDEALAILGE